MHKETADATVADSEWMDLFKRTMHAGRQSNDIFGFPGNTSHNFLYQLRNAHIIRRRQINAGNSYAMIAIYTGVRADTVHQDTVKLTYQSFVNFFILSDMIK